MKNLKTQLIRLGSTNPELRVHLRPVLDTLVRTASLDQHEGPFRARRYRFRYWQEALAYAIANWYRDDLEDMPKDVRPLVEELKSDPAGREVGVFTMDDGNYFLGADIVTQEVLDLAHREGENLARDKGIRL